MLRECLLDTGVEHVIAIGRGATRRDIGGHGVIQPLHGIQSRTTMYRVAYVLFKPLMPILRGAFPGRSLTTERIGPAMLKVARNGAPKRVLDPRDISML